MTNTPTPQQLDIILSEFMSKHITAETLTDGTGVGGFALYKILIIR